MVEYLSFVFYHTAIKLSSSYYKVHGLGFSCFSQNVKPLESSPFMFSRKPIDSKSISNFLAVFNGGKIWMDNALLRTLKATVSDFEPVWEKSQSKKRLAILSDLKPYTNTFKVSSQIQCWGVCREFTKTRATKVVMSNLLEYDVILCKEIHLPLQSPVHLTTNKTDFA